MVREKERKRERKREREREKEREREREREREHRLSFILKKNSYACFSLIFIMSLA